MPDSLSSSLTGRQWREMCLHISAPTRERKSGKGAEKEKKDQRKSRSKEGRGIREMRKEKESNEELKKRETEGVTD